jgi:hypothetical protein
MDRYRTLALAIGATAALAVLPLRAPAQVSIRIGPAPDCPYGYYDYPPYACAPYGYYGPEWFLGGIFIGAGPWFHGPHEFRGHVDGRFDPRHGYNGPYPRYGERRDPDHHMDRVARGFRGSETRDGRSHEEHEHPR